MRKPYIFKRNASSIIEPALHFPQEWSGYHYQASQPASQPAKPLGVIEPAKPLGLIEPALHFPQDCFKYHRASLTFPIGMLGIIEPALQRNALGIIEPALHFS